MIDEPTPTAPKSSFVIHRFATDAIGHFLAGYFVALLSTLIDPHSDGPRAFPHGFALCLAASYLVCDYLAAWFLANSKWFGLISLVVASLAAGLLCFVGSTIYEGFTRPGSHALEYG
jgi:hypothetical protein